MANFAIVLDVAALHNCHITKWDGSKGGKTAIRRHVMRRILTLAVAAWLVPASAGATTHKVSEVVSYEDLDLFDPQDLRTLEDRISVAVVNVCGAPATPSIWAVKAVDECRSAASEDAKAQLEARLATLAPVSVAAAE